MISLRHLKFPILLKWKNHPEEIKPKEKSSSKKSTSPQIKIAKV